MIADKPKVVYEEAAEQRTVTGWVCRTCQRYWGRDERMARWCCATDLPCECGARITNKHYACCEACLRRKTDEKWAKRLAEAVDWDGETPLCTHDDDRFFFSAEEIADHIADHVEEYCEEGTTLDLVEAVESLRLCLCEPSKPREFEMTEYLSDHLPDDDHGGGDLDCAEINKAVNDWIEAHSPLSWRSTQKAVTTASVLNLIDVPT